MTRLSPADWATACVVVLLWGINFVAVKMALTGLPPFLLTGLRFVFVAAALAPFFRPRPEQLPGIALIGLVLGLGHFGLLIFGLSGMDAATAAIAIQLGVPFSALLAWLAFGERLGWRRGLGMAVAFSGVAVLAGEPHLPSLGYLIAVVAGAFAWAVANVIIKRLGAISPLALNGWTGLCAAPLLLGLSVVAEHGQMAAMAQAGWRAWAGLGYVVVFSSLVAYTLWYRLLERHPMNRVVPFTLLGPGIGLVAGVVLLGEPLTWQKLVGGALTVLGVAAIELIPDRKGSAT